MQQFLFNPFTICAMLIFLSSVYLPHHHSYLWCLYPSKGHRHRNKVSKKLICSSSAADGSMSVFYLFKFVFVFMINCSIGTLSSFILQTVRAQSAERETLLGCDALCVFSILLDQSHFIQNPGYKQCFVFSFLFKRT